MFSFIKFENESLAFRPGENGDIVLKVYTVAVDSGIVAISPDGHAYTSIQSVQD